MIRLLNIFAFLFLCFHGFSQPAECGAPTFSGTCAGACVTCGDIDGLMMTTLTNSGVDLPPGFCTFIGHNSSWLGFIAGSTDLTLRVNVGACSTGSIEMEIWGGCNCSDYQLVSSPCYLDMLPFTSYDHVATGLDIGKYYWLVFDGNGGPTFSCDVTFEVISGSTGAQGSPNVGPMDGERSVCLDDIEDYSIPEVTAACSYDWTLDGGGNIVSPTDQNIVTVQWNTPGVWELCVEPEVLCSGAPILCELITVEDVIPPTELDDEYVCENGFVVVGGTPYFEGEHFVVLESAAGCDSIVEFEVIEIPDQLVQISETICYPDCYRLGFEDYCESGAYSQLLMQENEPFCDSLIELELNVLRVEPEITKSGDLDCENNTVTLSSINSLLEGDGDIEYQWRDENGNIIGSDPDIMVSDPGEYTLIITIISEDGTVTCDELATIEVFSDSSGPFLDYPFQLTACNNDTIFFDTLSIEDLNDAGGAISFHTDNPADANNEITDNFIVPNTDTTIYVFAVAGNCTDIIALNIQVGPNLGFDGSPTICAGQQIQLSMLNIVDSNNTSSTLTFHSATPANPANELMNSTVAPTSTTTYYVLASNGPCLDEIPITIEVGSSIAIDPPIVNQIDCTRDSVLIQTGLNDPTLYSIEWTDSNGNVLNSQGQSQTYVFSSGWYYVMATDTSSSCFNIDSIFVDENFDLPALSTQDTSIFTCNDTVVSLNGNTDFSFPNLQWSWYTNNGNILSDPNNTTITADAPGDYFFTILNTDNGCADTVQQTIIPDQDRPSLNLSGDQLLTCDIQAITLTASGSTASGSNPSFEWTTLDGNILSDPTENQITVSDPGTYRVRLLDPANGCYNTQSITIQIDTVAPILSFGTSPVLDCQVSNILIAPSQIENAQYDYSWSTSNGNIIGNTNQYQIQADQAGIYYLNVTNTNNGCSSTDSLVVNQDANTPIAIIAPPPIIDCSQTEIVLNAGQSSSGPNLDINWQAFNGGNFSDLSDPLNPRVDQAGTYRLIILNMQNGCIDSFEVNVQSNVQNPIIELNTPDSLGCNNAQSIISADISNASNALINWTTADGNIVSNPQSNQITVNQQGFYYIEVQNPDNGCLAIDSIEVFGIATGPTGFDLFSENPRCDDEQAVFIVSNVIGGAPPYSILLDQMPITLNDTLNVSPGTHIVDVIDANGCNIRDTFFISELPIYSANIGNDFEITAGDLTRLIPQFSFDTSLITNIEWSPSEAVTCSDCLITDFIAGQSTTLELIVTTVEGCSAFADITITVIPFKDVFIPNTFSPNGDKKNDFFTVFGMDGRVIQIKSLRVFNRWGDLVFEKLNFPTNDESQGWDGTHNGNTLDPAVFIYAAEVEFADGKIRIFAGDVTLIK